MKTSSGGGSSIAPTSVRDMLIIAALVLGVGSVLLLVVTAGRPVERVITTMEPYEQRGTFSYTATAPPGVYDAEQVSTGEPVFLRLTKEMPVRFDYQVTSSAPVQVSGTYRLVARLSQENGWQRTLELAPATPFTGPAVSVADVVELEKLQEFVAAAEQQTGVKPSRSTLTIAPEINVEGTVADVGMKDRFGPTLDFRLDPLQLALDQSSTKENPLQPAQGGSVKRPGTAANRISVLFLGATVAQARVLALAGLVGAALLGLAAEALTLRAGRADEPARICAQHGPLLLDVRGAELGAAGRTVEVARFEDLAKLAIQDNRMILHRNGGATHRYTVVDGDLIYQYVTPADSVLASKGASTTDEPPFSPAA